MSKDQHDESPVTSASEAAKFVAALGKNDVLRLVLRLWKEGHLTQDVRYDNKGILKLVSLSLTDSDFRHRLLNNTQHTLAEVPAGHLPVGLELKFYENTANTLHIVLPPVGGGLEHRSPRFQERLFSRTSTADMALSADDADIGDWSLDQDHGDLGARDHMNSAPPIALPEAADSSNNK
ncbi:hypothetical protein GFL72_16985 [Rhizobium leguminosarum bv. viciae]|uniref:hypothetical protein n=1 Tax=Rhizobium leguminosarum TaxID=384 RepID=UPI001442594E|nr:hypothetical protein [Rhizobium leguminosarum]NKK36321.1 hypothetical protein [Rhizobium leguminosarum bv. viciae]